MPPSTIYAFAPGNNCFIALPTGYGKSAIAIWCLSGRPDRFFSFSPTQCKKEKKRSSWPARLI